MEETRPEEINAQFFFIFSRYDFFLTAKYSKNIKIVQKGSNGISWDYYSIYL